ncbi:MAG: hypothetical protein QRY72_05315 [Candidatus Rhabdochlamydia sp.]
MNVNNNFNEGFYKRTQQESEIPLPRKKNRNDHFQDHNNRSSQEIQFASHESNKDTLEEESEGFSVELTSLPLCSSDELKKITEKKKLEESIDQFNSPIYISSPGSSQDESDDSDKPFSYSNLSQGSRVKDSQEEESEDDHHSKGTVSSSNHTQTLNSEEEESEDEYNYEEETRLLEHDPIQTDFENELIWDIERWETTRDLSRGIIKCDIARCFSQNKKSILTANNINQLILAIEQAFFDHKNRELITTIFINKLYQAICSLQEKEEQELFHKNEALSIIKNLHLSFTALERYGDWNAIKIICTTHKEQNPNIYLTSIAEQLKKPLGELYRQIINQAPCYTVKDWNGLDAMSYIIGVEKDTKPWIFKPLFPSPQIFQENQSMLDASNLNFHRKFPILDTFLIKTKNMAGRINRFIPQLDVLSILSDRSSFNQEFMRKIEKLIMFDILFCYGERNYNHILTNGVNILYGIKNKITFSPPKALNIMYFWLAFPDTEEGQNQLFDADTLELVSEENCMQYQKILESLKAPDQFIKWIEHVGSFLRARGHTSSIKELMSSVRKMFIDFFY